MKRNVLRRATAIGVFFGILASCFPTGMYADEALFEEMAPTTVCEEEDYIEDELVGSDENIIVDDLEETSFESDDDIVCSDDIISDNEPQADILVSDNGEGIIAVSEEESNLFLQAATDEGGLPGGA